MSLVNKHLGLVDYQNTWQQMKDFTQKRKEDTPDELWYLEHFPVYTQGQAGKAEHILNSKSIPIVQTDRGGQVTYHGPGQLVVYCLLDIDRRNLGVRSLVTMLEKSLIDLLEQYGIVANTKCGAPGVFVSDSKIASIGLRVKKGRTYHGIALNIDMDLQPFKGINPCGFAKMNMTQIKEFVQHCSLSQVSMDYQFILSEYLGKN